MYESDLRWNDRLGLEPYGQGRGVHYVVLTPASTFISDQAKAFMIELRNSYKVYFTTLWTCLCCILIDIEIVPFLASFQILVIFFFVGFPVNSQLLLFGYLNGFWSGVKAGSTSTSAT